MIHQFEYVPWLECLHIESKSHQGAHSHCNWHQWTGRMHHLETYRDEAENQWFKHYCKASSSLKICMLLDVFTYFPTIGHLCKITMVVHNISCIGSSERRLRHKFQVSNQDLKNDNSSYLLTWNNTKDIPFLRTLWWILVIRTFTTK